MRIYYLECLAQATYIISHDGNAFIVDPRRDVDAFIQVRKRAKLIFEQIKQLLSMGGYLTLSMPFLFVFKGV